MALFVLILLGFFILIAQHFFHFSKVRKLQGAFIPKEQPILTSSNWFSGNYQDSLSIYLNENIGFRNYFVRLNNQIAFSLFDFARANGVVVGKENFLYERNYIRAYLGKDYIGEAAIAEKVRKLEKIQDRLKKRDIELIVVFAPGKGSFYPEYIPTDQVPSENNNYKTYVRLLNNTPINLIDFNKWFRKKKGTTVAPLYPKTGIHWSRFGELMAADSLLKYIDKLKGIQLPQFNFTDTLYPDKTKFTDADIEEGMNLLFNIKDLQMAYPNYTVLKNESTNETRAMVVADSYYWGLYGHGFASDFLLNGQFWYYNEQVYESGRETRLVSELNVKEEIEQHNVVILLSTDANLNRFCYGFIDQVYELYNITAEQELEERIQLMEKIIKSNEQWFSDIKEDAVKKGISVQKALRENAEYMIWIKDKAE